MSSPADLAADFLNQLRRFDSFWGHYYGGRSNLVIVGVCESLLGGFDSRRSPQVRGLERRAFALRSCKGQSVP